MSATIHGSVFDLKIGDPVMVLFNATPMQVSIHPQTLQSVMSLSVLPGKFNGWVTRHFNEGVQPQEFIRVVNKAGDEYLFDLDTVTLGKPAAEKQLVE